MDQKSSLHVESVCKRILVHFDRIAFISLSKQRQKSMTKKEKTLTVTRCFESNESKQIEPRGASLTVSSCNVSIRVPYMRIGAVGPLEQFDGLLLKSAHSLVHSTTGSTLARC